LKTKRYRLAGSDITIPSDIGCSVRIGASEGSIPGAGYPISGITPIDAPAINRCARIIFDSDAGNKTGVPFVINGIGTGRKS